MGALVRSCHPEPTAAVTLLVTAFAATTGRDVLGVVLVGAAVLTGQLSIGWLNDSLDADRDVAVGRPDKPVVAGRGDGVGAADGAAVVAALACVPLSLASGPLAGAVHLVAVAAGWAYDAGLKSTAASVVPYVVCFGLLPVFVVLGLPGSPPPPWWLPVGGRAARRGRALRQRPARPRRRRRDRRARAAAPVGCGRLAGPRRRCCCWRRRSCSRWVRRFRRCWPPRCRWWRRSCSPPGSARGRRPGSRAPFRAVLVVAGVAAALLVAAGPALVG